MTGFDLPDIPAMHRALDWLLRPQIAFALLLALCCLALVGGLVLQRALATYVAEPAELPANPQAFAADNLRPLAPAQAKELNQAQPLAASDNPAASPFTPAFAESSERLKSINCLASAIYYEAGAESEAGQRAVAQVVLNRVRHVAYPDSVCGVVYQGAERSTGCQFTFTCDGSLARRPGASGWARAQRVAEAALSGEVFARVGRALHYHADYVVPYWSSSLVKSAVVGAHIFYLSPGSAGRAAAFTARYAGIEPDLRPAVVRADAGAPEEAPVAETGFAKAGALRGIPEPPVADVPEDRARELDRFALLDYKADKQPAAAAPAADLPLETALSSALGGGRKQEVTLSLQQHAP